MSATGAAIAGSAPAAAPPHGRITPLDRLVAGRLQRLLESVAIRLELWDGSSSYEGAVPPTADLVAGDRGTLLGLVSNPDLHFGDAYSAGRLRVRGDLERTLEALSRLDRSVPSWRDRMMAALVARNTPAAARRNVHHHYDLGNDFYRLWLDDQLVYTCAYFPCAEMSLEDAQQAKMELVCRKLALGPNDTAVDAGCGWGALALHMAREHGVRVKAFNISREQIAFARERARREDLGPSRVEFIEDDYRNVTGRFDAFVSIGMLEHVGRRNFRDLSEVLRRTVRPDGGRGLLHFIGRDLTRPLNAWIRRRIFPGTYTPTLAEATARILEPARMSVVDVENLRLHYARTLRHWSRRFAAAADRVEQQYGPHFRRAWELYLAGSEAAFATGWLQLFQVVFTPSGARPPLWTRDSLYASPETDPCPPVTS